MNLSPPSIQYHLAQADFPGFRYLEIISDAEIFLTLIMADYCRDFMTILRGLRARFDAIGEYLPVYSIARLGRSRYSNKRRMRPTYWRSKRLLGRQHLIAAALYHADAYRHARCRRFR